ncbi:hypothetical protein NITMOv2_3801 [Nitrospira moscoviensis]|uniref:Uncharacterized protein n=1 Tax=Nitrospira moscoviensis TaxID=42253 RepID=A0A0K2GGX6_NITMO|nr:hypothetical protein NITMOv2_3801 [Nitrospira moscoviensis]
MPREELRDVSLVFIAALAFDQEFLPFMYLRPDIFEVLQPRLIIDLEQHPDSLVMILPKDNADTWS